MRRGAILALGLLVGVSLSASSVTATAYKPNSPQAPVADLAYTNCDTLSNIGGFGGRDMGHSYLSYPFRGIKAYMTADLGLHMCSGPTILDPFGLGGSYAWIAVQAPYNNTNSIIQIGLVMCNDDVFSNVCTGHAGQLRYFEAEGGCNGDTPDALDLGQADYGTHLYEVALWGDGNWHIKLDSHDKVILANTDSRISCWTGRSDTTWVFDGERHDGADGWGASAPASTLFSVMQLWWGSPLAWKNINISGCGVNSSDEHCQLVSSDSIEIWTTN
jgi:hypothetical protein